MRTYTTIGGINSLLGMLIHPRNDPGIVVDTAINSNEAGKYIKAEQLPEKANG